MPYRTLDLCLRETGRGKDYREVFLELRFQIDFRSHENEKPALELILFVERFQKARRISVKD